MILKKFKKLQTFQNNYPQIYLWTNYNKILFLDVLNDPSYPTPPLGQDMTRSIFKWSLTGLNSEFSFS